jgi:hypothetical protein
LYKTTDGGQSWAETSDYAWNTIAGLEWDGNPIGANFFTFGLALARSYQDPSTLYVCSASLNTGGGNPGEAPIAKVTASTMTVISKRYSEWPTPRWLGTWNRHGLKTLDTDADVILMNIWRPTGAGNSSIAVFKTEDKGQTALTVILPDAGPHNIEPAIHFGGDGSVFFFRAVGTAWTAFFHPDIYSLTSSAQFIDKTGTGLPFITLHIFFALFGL